MLPLQYVNAGQHTIGARCLAGGRRLLTIQRNRRAATKTEDNDEGSEFDHLLPIGQPCKLNGILRPAPGFLLKKAAGSSPTPPTSTGNPGLYDCLLVWSRNVEFATVMSCPSLFNTTCVAVTAP